MVADSVLHRCRRHVAAAAPHATRQSALSAPVPYSFGSTLYVFNRLTAAIMLTRIRRQRGSRIAHPSERNMKSSARTVRAFTRCALARAPLALSLVMLAAVAVLAGCNSQP